MGSIAHMEPKLPSKCRDVSWPYPQLLAQNYIFQSDRLEPRTPAPPPLNCIERPNYLFKCPSYCIAKLKTHFCNTSEFVLDAQSLTVMMEPSGLLTTKIHLLSTCSSNIIKLQEHSIVSVY